MLPCSPSPPSVPTPPWDAARTFDRINSKFDKIIEELDRMIGWHSYKVGPWRFRVWVRPK